MGLSLLEWLDATVDKDRQEIYLLQTLPLYSDQKWNQDSTSVFSVLVSFKLFGGGVAEEKGGRPTVFSSDTVIMGSAHRTFKASVTSCSGCS